MPRRSAYHGVVGLKDPVGGAHPATDERREGDTAQQARVSPIGKGNPALMELTCRSSGLKAPHRLRQGTAKKITDGNGLQQKNVAKNRLPLACVLALVGLVRRSNW